MPQMARCKGINSCRVSAKSFGHSGIVAFFTLGCWLFIDAAVRGPGEYQLWIASILLIGGVSLVATWFWSPFG
jgi:hypothetical protein